MVNANLRETILVTGKKFNNGSWEYSFLLNKKDAKIVAITKETG